MSSSESSEHRGIKETVSAKLSEWFDTSLVEFQDSGHELDVLAVTPRGISIYVEIIWSSSRTNFFRDMNMIQTSDADVKLVIVSPEVLNKKEFQREFEKVAIAQRRLNFAIHGKMIEGERILEESDYLDIEFKKIITLLLNRVNIRGRIIGTKAEYEPPKIHSIDNVKEKWISNLFLVLDYPKEIFVSSTSTKTIRETKNKIGPKANNLTYLLKKNKLYSFNDLNDPLSPFKEILCKETITKEAISKWFQDSEKRRDIITMFNHALRVFCNNRNLDYDKKHHRYVCLLEDDGRTNLFYWRPHVKNVARKLAVCKKGNDGNVLFVKHYAADLKFMFLDNQIYLKIEPTITFTYDGWKPIRSSRLALLMSKYLSKQYNNIYHELVRFWGKYLSRLDKTIPIPLGLQKIEVDAKPIGVSTNFGIIEERG